MTQSDDTKNDKKSLHKLTTQNVGTKWWQKNMIKCDDTKVIYISNYTNWWPKLISKKDTWLHQVMTYGDDRKWYQKFMTQRDDTY